MRWPISWHASRWAGHRRFDAPSITRHMAREGFSLTMETFNTLKAARKIEETGLPREQAEAIVQVVYQYKLTLDQERDMASKIDALKSQSDALMTKIAGLQRDIAGLRSAIVDLKVRSRI